LLRDIEQAVGAPLEIAGLPTVADMREHRLDMLRGSLREALVAGGFERYRAVVESLSEEFDLVDIALAALSQADAEARGAEDVTELAPAALPTFARPAHGAGQRPRFGEDRSGAPSAPRPAPGRHGVAGPARGPVPAGPARGPVPAGPRKGFRPSGWHDAEGRPVLRAPRPGSGGSGITRLFVGAGRAAGVRPGDLVGAITNEAGLRGGDIGAIQVADGFSLVEVPEAAAEHVIRALRGASIRGQQVVVRRERF
jgi:ATP-dependent RNA helicase DeaD